MASEPPPGSRVRRAAARILKIAGIAAAVVLIVMAVCAAFVSSRYFTSAVETRLAKGLLETKHRTLKFDGPLEFSFWPNAGFKVGRLSLSEPNSAQEFASIDSARFSVAVTPLFKGRIAVDQCAVDGLKAIVVKHRDGTLNIDDLFVSEEPSGSNFAIDAAGIEVRHSALTWRNEANGADVAVDDIDFSGARLQADTATKTLSADQLSLAGSTGDVRVHLDLAGIAASPAALTAERVDLDIRYKSGDTAIGGSLGSRLAADPQRGTIALEDLAGELDVAHPRLAQPVKLPLRGALHAGRNAADGNLSMILDESKAAIKLKATRYSPLALHFDVDVDRLDIDRYLSPNHTEAAPEKPSPMNLSALQGLAVDGTARVGTLEIGGIKTSNIRLEIRSAQGKLDVRSMKGR